AGPMVRSSERAAGIALAAAVPAAIPWVLGRTVRYSCERGGVCRVQRRLQNRPIWERDARGHRGDDVRKNAVRRGRGGGLLRGIRVETRREEIRPMPRLDCVDRIIDGAL